METTGLQMSQRVPNAGFYDNYFMDDQGGAMYSMYPAADNGNDYWDFSDEKMVSTQLEKFNF